MAEKKNRNVLVTRQFGNNRGFRFALVHPGEKKIVDKSEFYGKPSRLDVEVPNDNAGKPTLNISTAEGRGHSRKKVLTVGKEGVSLTRKGKRTKVEVVPAGDGKKFHLVDGRTKIQRPPHSHRMLAEEAGLMDMTNPINE